MQYKRNVDRFKRFAVEKPAVLRENLEQIGWLFTIQLIEKTREK